MALNEKELALALKGYPVKMSNGGKVYNLKFMEGIGKLVGVVGKSQYPAAWYEDGTNFDPYEVIGNKKCELHLDHEEARRINFVPQPEFGDEIEVMLSDNSSFVKTYFVHFDNEKRPVCVVPHNRAFFEIGEPFKTIKYNTWRWPSDSPYNISDRYEVLKNGEPVEVSEEKMKCITKILKEE